jgi:hypothetical protein
VVSLAIGTILPLPFKATEPGLLKALLNNIYNVKNKIVDIISYRITDQIKEHEMEKACSRHDGDKILLGTSEGKTLYKDPDVSRMIILKWMD